MDRQEAWPWPEATKPGGCAERNSHFLKDCQLKLELYLGLWGCFCLKYHVFFKKSKKIVCDSAWSVSSHTGALFTLMTLTLAVNQWELQQKWLPKSKNHCSAPGLVLSPALGRRLAQHPLQLVFLTPSAKEWSEVPSPRVWMMKKRGRAGWDLSHSASELLLYAITSVWDTFMELLWFHSSILNRWQDILVFYNGT